MRRTILLSLFFVTTAALALPPDTVERAGHFILEPQHALQPAEVAELRAKGVIIGQALGGNRFMARVADRAAIAGDLRIRSLEPYDGSRKIAPSAYSEAAKGRVFARVRVMFHDEVGLDEARQAIESAGGTLEVPLAINWQLPNTLVAKVPAAEMNILAADERVFGIYGPPLRVQANNAVAAGLSKVTPLFSAPYNLSGQNVVLSEFELATADASHVQFQGRLTTHFTLSNTDNALHATHVAGTMISAGLDDPRDSRGPFSKGMAPKATLHEFSVVDDFANVVSNKDTQLKTLGVVADNNSWDFTLGWSFESPNWVWNGDFFGAYDATYSSPYDAVAVKSGSALFVHSNGNDATNGNPGLSGLSQHLHCCTDSGNTIKNEIFCYSPSGSGNDCTAPCSTGVSAITGEAHCEATHHPTYGPYQTVGLEASLKNVVSVGAVDVNGFIAVFSSRGPARDGRIKPEVVAKGVNQISTIPGNAPPYAARQGTSMSSPVVTGISALLVEQWRKTFAGQTPSGSILKTLLIAGADDQVGDPKEDLPGPDYTHGFGLADAKASVDLIIADGGAGTRIRTGTVHNGDTLEFPLSLSAGQNLRVVLGWFDPEIFPAPEDPIEAPTLLNDLDVKVIDPSGATVLPYVLDKNNPTNAATRGVNHVDTTEEVEIKNAAAGQYRVVINAKLGDPTGHPAQDFVLIANANLSAAAPPCGDNFEPNNTQAAAFKYLASGQTVSARACAASDLDFYDINVQKAGPLSVVVTATDTPLRATLTGNGITPIVVDIPAQSSRTLSTNATVGIYEVEVQSNGAVATANSYTVTATFSQPSTTTRHRAARR
jgi:hypothetical protein